MADHVKVHSFLEEFHWSTFLQLLYMQSAVRCSYYVAMFGIAHIAGNPFLNCIMMCLADICSANIVDKLLKLL